VEKSVYFLVGSNGLAEMLGEGNFPFERIYAGNEMCDRLLPAKAEFRSMLGAASARGIRVSLMTPVHVLEVGLARIAALIRIAQESPAVDEVVVNDWGVWELVPKSCRLSVVLGRMMNRLKRDTRINLGDLPTHQVELLRSGNLTNSPYRRFLWDRGVRRAEFDCLAQGVDTGLAGSSISASIFYPILPVSYSPSCILGATHRQGREKFDVTASCRKECRRYHMRVPELGVEVIGKCVYGINNRLDSVDMSQFDRIVQVVL
jgi:hypothetical protein